MLISIDDTPHATDVKKFTSTPMVKVMNHIHTKCNPYVGCHTEISSYSESTHVCKNRDIQMTFLSARHA